MHAVSIALDGGGPSLCHVRAPFHLLAPSLGGEQWCQIRCRAVLSVAAATAAVCGIIYHQVSGFNISRIVDGVADSAKSLTKWDNSKVSHAVQVTTLMAGTVPPRSYRQLLAMSLGLLSLSLAVAAVASLPGDAPWAGVVRLCGLCNVCMESLRHQPAHGLSILDLLRQQLASARSIAAAGDQRTV